MSKGLKRKASKVKKPKLRPRGFTPEEARRGGLRKAAGDREARAVLTALEAGELVHVGPKAPEGTPCPLLERNQRKLREMRGEPEPKRVVIPPPPVDPRLLALQDMDYERRVRLLSDD